MFLYTINYLLLITKKIINQAYIRQKNPKEIFRIYKYSILQFRDWVSNFTLVRFPLLSAEFGSLFPHLFHFLAFFFGAAKSRF